MKRTGCIVAAALLLGLLLAGITGYFIWHSAQDKYVRAEMVGVSGGTGVAGVEAPEPEEGDGQKQAPPQIRTAPKERTACKVWTAPKEQTARTQRMAVYPPIQTTLKHRGPEQEHQMRTLR